MLDDVSLLNWREKKVRASTENYKLFARGPRCEAPCRPDALGLRVSTNERASCRCQCERRFNWATKGYPHRLCGCVPVLELYGSSYNQVGSNLIASGGDKQKSESFRCSVINLGVFCWVLFIFESDRLRLESSTYCACMNRWSSCC